MGGDLSIRGRGISRSRFVIFLKSLPSRGLARDLARGHHLSAEAYPDVLSHVTDFLW